MAHVQWKRSDSMKEGEQNRDTEKRNHGVSRNQMMKERNVEDEDEDEDEEDDTDKQCVEEFSLHLISSFLRGCARTTTPPNPYYLPVLTLLHSPPEKGRPISWLHSWLVSRNSRS
jgi:hypothetical protein